MVDDSYDRFVLLPFMTIALPIIAPLELSLINAQLKLPDETEMNSDLTCTNWAYGFFRACQWSNSIWVSTVRWFMRYFYPIFSARCGVAPEDKQSSKKVDNNLERLNAVCPAWNEGFCPVIFYSFSFWLNPSRIKFFFPHHFLVSRFSAPTLTDTLAPFYLDHIWP